MDTTEKTTLQTAWLKSAQEDLDTAQDLFSLKRYHYALFFCQLALEKVLKALVVKKNNTHPLPIHKLAKLAKDASLDLTQEQIDSLNEITTFNIEARYDILKEQLHKKATQEFTEKYLKITADLFTFFKSQV